MAIVVQKYGGSSVADVEKLGRVAEKVVAARRAGEDVVVVVSAMGKTTDQLLALAKQVDETPPRRELDMLLTTGERVSMALLSMAIQKRGVDAISFTGSQSGIITNDRHFDARIIEVRPHRIEDELARGKVVIIAGYQGMSYRREITTLGRGGSDTTAIALAAALGAARAEIYSDVDGVYSADPRVVPDARHLPELTYEQMQEMADVGAKVLNAQAVEFARRAGIAIHARSTFQPGRESVVRRTVEGGGTAVVGQKGIVRARVRDASALRDALAIASEFALPARDVSLESDGATLVLATSLAPDWAAARARLEREVAGIAMESGLGAASVVGGATSEALLDVIAALGRREIVARGIVQNATRISALVREDDVDHAVQTLHEEIVAKE
ncbi:aspartate kinase [Sandaracinus amylolyticus]|uniref:aspartate kinase n=1 Tax=Sandaracinus amylolyticus TaxID=927083 RepID=UPI001F00DBAF|nr:aspartate kinase [Sandaracinus amylolyticus]UJR80948.1 Aspartate kinase [Sandaracinus amylolyticus]